MYYKISNELDFRCIYRWLSESQGKETIERMTPVVDAIFRCVKILEEEYKGNKNPDYRGGYVALIDRAGTKTEYLEEILSYYNLNEDEFEYENLLCTCLSQEHTKVTWMERLYILSDFQIVLIYPVEEGGK